MPSPAAFIAILLLIQNTATAADTDDHIVAFLTEDIKTLPTGPPDDFRDLQVRRRINHADKSTSFIFDTYNLFYDEVVVRLAEAQNTYVIREYPTTLSFEHANSQYFMYLILQQLQGDNFRAFAAFVRKLHPDDYLPAAVTINSDDYIIEYAPHLLTDIPEDHFFVNSIYFNNYTSAKTFGRSATSSSASSNYYFKGVNGFLHDPNADPTLFNPHFTEFILKFNYTITTFSGRKEVFDGIKSGNISLNTLPPEVIDALVKDFGNETIGNSTLSKLVETLPPLVIGIPHSNSTCSDCIPNPPGDETFLNQEFEVVEVPGDIVDIVDLPTELVHKPDDSTPPTIIQPNNTSPLNITATPTGSDTFIININNINIDNSHTNNIIGNTFHEEQLKNEILCQAAQQCPSTCAIIPKQPPSMRPMISPNNNAPNGTPQTNLTQPSKTPTDAELLKMFQDIQSGKLNPGSIASSILAALIQKFGAEHYGNSTFAEVMWSTLNITHVNPNQEILNKLGFKAIHPCTDMDMFQLLYHTTHPKATKPIQVFPRNIIKHQTTKIIRKRIKLACLPKSNQMMWFSYNLQLFKRKVKKPYKVIVNLPNRSKRSLTVEHEGLIRLKSSSGYPLGFSVGSYLGGDEVLNVKIFQQAQRWLTKDNATASDPERVFYEQIPKLTFIGLSKCSPPKQLTLADLDAASDAEQLVKVFMKALRTDCGGGLNQFVKLYQPAIDSGCLRISSSGKHFEIPETCKLLSIKKLCRSEQDQLKTAIEISAFSKTYMEFLTVPQLRENCLGLIIKENIAIVSPSTACFISLLAANTILDAREQIPLHSALIDRWLRTMLLSSRAALYADMDALKCRQNDNRSCRASLKRIQGQQSWLAQIQEYILVLATH